MSMYPSAPSTSSSPTPSAPPEYNPRNLNEIQWEVLPPAKQGRWYETTKTLNITRGVFTSATIGLGSICVWSALYLTALPTTIIAVVAGTGIAALACFITTIVLFRLDPKETDPLILAQSRQEALRKLNSNNDMDLEKFRKTYRANVITDEEISIAVEQHFGSITFEGLRQKFGNRFYQFLDDHAKNLCKPYAMTFLEGNVNHFDLNDICTQLKISQKEKKSILVRQAANRIIEESTNEKWIDFLKNDIKLIEHSLREDQNEALADRFYHFLDSNSFSTFHQYKLTAFDYFKSFDSRFDTLPKSLLEIELKFARSSIATYQEVLQRVGGESLHLLLERGIPLQTLFWNQSYEKQKQASDLELKQLGIDRNKIKQKEANRIVQNSMEYSSFTTTLSALKSAGLGLKDVSDRESIGHLHDTFISWAKDEFSMQNLLDHQETLQILKVDVNSLRKEVLKADIEKIKKNPQWISFEQFVSIYREHRAQMFELGLKLKDIHTIYFYNRSWENMYETRWDEARQELGIDSNAIQEEMQQRLQRSLQHKTFQNIVNEGIEQYVKAGVLMEGDIATLRGKWLDELQTLTIEQAANQYPISQLEEMRIIQPTDVKEKIIAYILNNPQSVLEGSLPLNSIYAFSFGKKLKPTIDDAKKLYGDGLKLHNEEIRSVDNQLKENLNALSSQKEKAFNEAKMHLNAAEKSQKEAEQNFKNLSEHLEGNRRHLTELKNRQNEIPYLRKEKENQIQLSKRQENINLYTKLFEEKNKTVSSLEKKLTADSEKINLQLKASAQSIQIFQEKEKALLQKQAEKNILEEQAASLMKQLSQITNEVTGIFQAVKAVNNNRTQADLQIRLSSVQGQLKNLQTVESELHTCKQDLQNAQKNHDEKKADLENQYDIPSQETELRNAKQELGGLKRSLEDQKTLTLKITNLQKEVDALSQEEMQNAQRITQLETEIPQLKRELENASRNQRTEEQSYNVAKRTFEQKERDIEQNFQNSVRQHNERSKLETGKIDQKFKNWKKEFFDYFKTNIEQARL